MYHKILVPLDGSTFAESALPMAVVLSRRTGAAVHFVTVLEPITSFAYEGWESAAVEWSQAYMEDVSGRVRKEVEGEVTTAILHGHAVDEIRAEAARSGANVIVLASHGRGALSRAWLGSVADGVVREADRPVVVVRPPDDEKEKPPPIETLRTILVPLDGSELSECALTHAVELGSLFDASYHLTRVVGYPFDITTPYLPHTVQTNQEIVEGARKKSAQYLEEHADRIRNHGYSVTTSVVVDAQPGHGILSEAEEVGADMIGMSTHGRRGLQRAFLGSTADKVLRGTHLPVLLFRPTKARD